VLDAGAFVAVDRRDRAMMGRLRVAQNAGLELHTTGVVVAQVWHDPAGPQANLAHLLKSVDIKAVDDHLGRQAGLLLGQAGMTDAADASVVAVAATGDRVLTSHPGDIRPLVAASGRSTPVIPC
jgi:hypothetical protein